MKPIYAENCRCSKLTDGSMKEPEYMLSHDVSRKKLFNVINDEVIKKDEDGNFRLASMVFIRPIDDEYIKLAGYAYIKASALGPIINYCPICGRKLVEDS